MSENISIAIIGGGAWGTALASIAASAGHDVIIWAREDDVITSINKDHVNAIFLPNCPLDRGIKATSNMDDVAHVDVVLMVAPAQFTRATLKLLPASINNIVLCSKGIEAETDDLLADIVAQERPEAKLAVLSGPTFAHEVAMGLPAAVTLASKDAEFGELLVQKLATPKFRPYYSDDVTGAEIGGAVKNVLAVACGVVDGAGLGLNARAGLIARGFAEMTRYGLARGGRAETLAGLSGLGDLVLTCSSENSRNFSLGRGLGQGKSAADMLSNRSSVAEGAFTAPVLQASAKKLGVAMPIVDAVCALLDGRSNVQHVVDALMSRPLKAE
ncbi:glycerol-3-phosphate dehydrogenase [Sphingorhabdus lutea]|uniref:Glycerol-3-phosphate dehydrogenase [NAD(P)+] n=1 Tax=Sphingorhabdus lutea TaxID=1913578 RepID=A0A1L3J8R3_9SPHN|nr:NAD(P)H-dependent glycerol-3-phosphate dehydrogenase [Sphingorhabdus lutea]APG61501.1 glycerol-3-phosphate dehydrogenase [Sphingorhabdus lutea]